MSGRANDEDVRLKVEGREQDIDFVAFGARWQFRGLWLLLLGCARAGCSLWHSGLSSFGCRAPTSGSETILFDCRQSYPHILSAVLVAKPPHWRPEHATLAAHSGPLSPFILGHCFKMESVLTARSVAFVSSPLGMEGS